MYNLRGMLSPQSCINAMRNEKHDELDSQQSNSDSRPNRNKPINRPGGIKYGKVVVR